MSLVVLDNFSESEDGTPHGEIVTDTAEQLYDGPIHTVDLEASVVSVETLEEELDHIYAKVATGMWDDVSALNLSFGESATRYPWSTKVWFPEIADTIQQLFSEGIDLTFSSGNIGEIFSGASIISTTPFNWSVGALNDEDNITDYSQHHPWIIDALADGTNEQYDAEGTSFSSPRMAGILAEVKEEHDLTPPEARTAYEITADYLTCEDDDHTGSIYWSFDANELLEIDGAFDIGPKVTMDAAYEVFLRRQPDKSGREWWTEQLDDKNNVHTIESFIEAALENNDFFSDETPGGPDHGRAAPVIEYVQAHYHLFLDREADLGGLEWWTDDFVDERYDSVKDFAQLTESFIDAAQVNDENIHLTGVADHYLDIVYDHVGC